MAKHGRLIDADALEEKVDRGMEDVVKDIAISLGRIADMLAEMNRYIVDYEDKERQEE